MPDYKTEAAGAALKLVQSGQIIGLGAGSTVAHFIALIADHTNLSSTLTFTSSSFKTTGNLVTAGLKVLPPSLIDHLDIYFDGCDQFDGELNALKSGGGIHTTEKILAAMADQFILMGDDTKFSPKMDGKYPLVIEILPQALSSVIRKIETGYPEAKIILRMSTQKDGALISDNGNLLADIHFADMPQLQHLNTQIKMIPGIVDHSLFYRLESKGIVAGNEGVKFIEPDYQNIIPQ